MGGGRSSTWRGAMQRVDVTVGWALSSTARRAFLSSKVGVKAHLSIHCESTNLTAGSLSCPSRHSIKLDACLFHGNSLTSRTVEEYPSLICFSPRVYLMGLIYIYIEDTRTRDAFILNIILYHHFPSNIWFGGSYSFLIGHNLGFQYFTQASTVGRIFLHVQIEILKS